jgi:hypothetical protein
MEPDYSTRYVVSPFGETNVIQAGVKVRRGRSLRALLTTVPDTSQMELNPESFRTLRERVLQDATD